MHHDWIIHFEFERQHLKKRSPDTEVWTLDMIKEGFWLTANMEPCSPQRGHFWIPPSRILLVQKLE